MKNLKLSLFTLLSIPLMAEPCYYSFGKRICLQPIPHAQTRSTESITNYRTPRGAKLGVRDEVIIGTEDFAACEPILKNYPIRKVEKLSDTLYLLRLEAGSDPFRIAESLYEERCTTLAHPNFVRERQRR